MERLSTVGKDVLGCQLLRCMPDGMRFLFSSLFSFLFLSLSFRYSIAFVFRWSSIIHSNRGRRDRTFELIFASMTDEERFFEHLKDASGDVCQKFFFSWEIFRQSFNLVGKTRITRKKKLPIQ